MKDARYIFISTDQWIEEIMQPTIHGYAIMLRQMSTDTSNNSCTTTATDDDWVTCRCFMQNAHLHAHQQTKQHHRQHFRFRMNEQSSDSRTHPLRARLSTCMINASFHSHQGYFSVFVKGRFLRGAWPINQNDQNDKKCFSAGCGAWPCWNPPVFSSSGSSCVGRSPCPC